MVAIEGLYIFDEHNNAILEHVYTGRPPSASVLLPVYLASSAQRSSVTYLPNLNPPTLVCSIIQDRLLFLCPASTDAEPLVILEFLHRVADALDEFLGSPLLASKIDSSYDVVAQIVGEVCDAGTISTTEGNALREVVEAPTLMGNLLGGIGLPAASPSLQASSNLQRSGSPFMPGIGSATTTSSTGSAIPWRRANVRHTSNELYVDIVEKLSVVMAPSGRPLSATANGTIVFNAKISGVPDLLLSLTAPGGTTGIKNAMDLPCFHPCVRLARWRERAGDLSFVPPDGKFVLASYETDLLPDLLKAEAHTIQTPNLKLPATIETRSSQGAYGDEFEVRLFIKQTSATTSSSSAAGSLNRNLSGTGRFGASLGAAGGSATPPSPQVEDLRIKVPILNAVRSVEDVKVSIGEAHYLASDCLVEWRVSSKEAATIGSNGAVLRCNILAPNESSDGVDLQSNGNGLKTHTFDYDDNAGPVQNGEKARPSTTRLASTASQRRRQNASLMPRSATLSFSMKGWLPSGIKVDSLTVNTKTSKGLGAGVTPYKGVKYHTVSQEGIEVRC